MNGNALRLFLIGPGIVLMLMSFLAISAMIAGACGRLPQFAALSMRSTERLAQSRPMLCLWGLSAVLLTLLSAAILVNIKALALLGIVLVVLGLTLAGLGLGVIAIRCGRSLAVAFHQSSPAPLFTLGLGLTTFFLSAFLPFLGWLLVLLAIFAGIGATLDTILRRPIP